MSPEILPWPLTVGRMSMWLWGRRRGFDGCHFWAFSSFGWAPHRLSQCGGPGMCQGQKLPRMECLISPAEQKSHHDIESTALSTGAQRCLRTRCCPFSHCLVLSWVEGGLGPDSLELHQSILTSTLKSTWLSFSEANSCVHIQCSSVLDGLFTFPMPGKFYWRHPAG